MNNRLEWAFERELIIGMQEHIEKLGVNEVWKIINSSLQGDARLGYIEVYINSIIKVK